MPVLAVALGLAASVAWGSSDFLAGRKARDLTVLSVLLVSQGAGLAAVLAALALTGTGAPSAETVTFAALAGVAELIGFAALYRGLAIGSMCIVAPVSASAAVVPLLVGFAGGDVVSAPQAIAVVLVLGGVVLAACESKTGGRRRVSLAQGAGLGLLAAAGFGTFFAGMGAAAGDGALIAVALSRVTAVVLLAGIVAVRAPSGRPARGDLGPLVVVGVLDALANVLFAVALTKGLVGVVSVLGSLYPVTTVLLARVVLGERITVVQRMGAIAAFAGVGAIAAFSV